MTEHTPTPWILDGTSVYYLDWDGESYEGKGKDCRQQLTNRFWCSMQGTQKRIPKEELEANAAFIVKAVNNHEALVKALKVLLEETESFSVSGVYFNEKCMGHKGPAMAYEVLALVEGRSP